MTLEHHRKTAKRLLRAFRAGDPRALQRAEAVLSERSQDRFGLTDAQHVVAVELGYRSWPDLSRTAKLAPGILAEESEPKRETEIMTDLLYRHGEPVRLRLVRRQQRISVTDDGSALKKAGQPRAWGEIADRLARELDVNVSRLGAIWLPVVDAGPGESVIVARIAEASRAFYQDLLDSEG